MRNCFVPGCDTYCRANNCAQRKMFFAPKEMFEKWKEKLPHKREFKKSDRVCERHFNENYIIQYWESKINGKVHKTLREKPRLANNAIPELNLPTWNEFPSPVLQKKQFVRIKTQIIKRDPKDEQKKELVPPVKKLKTESNEEKNKKLMKLNDNQNVIKPEIKKTDPVPELNDEEILEIFENLYEEIHDVTLPNTLYGINRCPDRQFIVFSEFDVKSMGFIKYLFIDKNLNCKICINGKITVKKLAKENCNTEFVSDWLDKIDSIKF